MLQLTNIVGVLLAVIFFWAFFKKVVAPEQAAKADRKRRARNL